MELFLETFDVQPMVRDVVTHHPAAGREERQRAGRRRARRRSGAMRADLTKVRQILFNLLSNASKFTDSGARSRSTVAPRPASDWIALPRHRHGHRHDARADRQAVPGFTQADASTTRKYGGTGLGLAISRRFCQMMGGDITVESSLGRGFDLHSRLPATSSTRADRRRRRRRRRHGGRSCRRRTASAPARAGHRRRPDVRDLLQRLLRRKASGSSRPPAGDEGSAWRASCARTRSRWTCMMPGMDGWAVLTALEG